MAPEFVTSYRLADKSYKVEWPRSELKDHVKAFVGYNVYRRKKGEYGFTGRALNAQPVFEEGYADTPPDAEDYVYTVKVVDALKNESAAAPVVDRDPFQGIWNGKLTLLSGEFKVPVVRAMEKGLADWVAKEKAAIAKLDKPEARQRATQQLEKDRDAWQKIIETIAEAVETAQLALRMGVPISFEVHLRDGQYYLQLRSLGYFPMDKGSELEMRAAGKGSLAPKVPMPPGSPSLVLQLKREDVIDVVYDEETPAAEGLEAMKYAIRVYLEREPNK
jgi:hypothetical protein